MQQADDFYNNQELAFAQDYELKAITAKLIEVQQKFKNLKKNFDEELRKHTAKLVK